MVTIAPTKYVILTCHLGRYEWWPDLAVLDFVPKRKRKGTPVAIGDLLAENPTQDQALELAVNHLTRILRRY